MIVDDIPSEMLASTLVLGLFGAHLSVRRGVKKPIVMCIGQDEAFYKQFLFLLSKMWTGPKGERSLLPKDEGAGVMISSSFIDIEYGLIQK